jgi:hydrogenase expression/formation protein HypC
MSSSEHCTGEVCITCSDTAVPVRVVELLDDDLAMVLTEAGTREEVSVALVSARVGDVVLVHAKEAIARVDEPAEAPELDAPNLDAPNLDTSKLDAPNLDTTEVAR